MLYYRWEKYFTSRFVVKWQVRFAFQANFVYKYIIYAFTIKVNAFFVVFTIFVSLHKILAKDLCKKTSRQKKAAKGV